MSMTDYAEIINRLDVLERKLEDDGAYVSANTVWLAMAEIQYIRMSIKNLQFEWRAEADKHESAIIDNNTEEDTLHKMNAETLRSCAIALSKAIDHH
jgi:hypothetical protein